MREIISLVSLEPDYIDEIEKKTKGYQFVDYSDGDYSLQDLSEAEIILGWNKDVAGALMNDQSKIKWIQVWSAGVDYLPLDLLQEKKVLLSNARGANAPAVAEQALTFMLMDARQAKTTVINQLNEIWEDPEDLTTLNNKTLMLLGTGQIATHIAKVAKALGMNTIGIDTHGVKKPHYSHVITFDDIEKFIDDADYVINTLPATDETTNLVDAEFFEHMDDSAMYINVGRGQTTNQKDLADALDSGEIRSAALDVFKKEPLPKNSKLWQIPNLLITPHMAGHFDDYDFPIVEIFLKNFKSYSTSGKLVENQVDLKRQY